MFALAHGGLGVSEKISFDREKTENALRFNQQMTTLSTVICQKLPLLSVPDSFNIHFVLQCFMLPKGLLCINVSFQVQNSDMVTDVQFLISSNYTLKNAPSFTPELLHMMISQRNLASIQKNRKQEKCQNFCFQIPFTRVLSKCTLSG